MNLLLILLDGAQALGPIMAIGFLFVALPIAALILLIYFFQRRKRKNK